MPSGTVNIDAREQTKFDAIAGEWWDPNGPLRTLHHINPVRLQYIKQAIDLKHKRVLDLGCGGGLLSEALARQQAQVTGLDVSSQAIAVAAEHGRQAGLVIDYITSSAEEYAAQCQRQFDVITCMELLEHVPDIKSLLQSCAQMLNPDGHLFLATINRSAKSYLAAIIAAEYLLKLLPRGTHDYARFIKPSELNQCLIESGFILADITGVTYLPGLNKCTLIGDPSINYIAHARLAV